MSVYLDTSALAKLVLVEVESAALRTFLATRAGQRRVSSAVARVELPRAAARGGGDARAVSVVLAGLSLVRLADALLDQAGRVDPSALRSLDAIHLASALTVRPLTAFVCYDCRLAEAAAALGLPVTAPS